MRLLEQMTTGPSYSENDPLEDEARAACEVCHRGPGVARRWGRRRAALGADAYRPPPIEEPAAPVDSPAVQADFNFKVKSPWPSHSAAGELMTSAVLLARAEQGVLAMRAMPWCEDKEPLGVRLMEKAYRIQASQDPLGRDAVGAVVASSGPGGHYDPWLRACRCEPAAIGNPWLCMQLHVSNDPVVTITFAISGEKYTEFPLNIPDDLANPVMPTVLLRTGMSRHGQAHIVLPSGELLTSMSLTWREVVDNQAKSAANRSEPGCQACRTL